VIALADTNVWIYSIDRQDPNKRQRATEVLASTQVIVSTQVMSEFYVVATRKLSTPLRPAEARAFVANMARLQVVALDAGLVSAAVDGSIEWGISYWDALIIRAAEAAGCDRVLSEDLDHGRTYGSVTVEDPFR
jgi:predicted nucleic acid-binding protein